MTGRQLNAVEELANIDKGVDWALVWGDRHMAAAASAREEEIVPPESTPGDEVVAPEPAVIVASPPLDARDCDPGVAVETKSTAAAKAVEASPPPPALEITLTRLTKKGGPFTKKIALAANGSLVNDHSACSLSVGTAERIKVVGVAGLGAVIEGLTPSQGLALGSLRSGLMDTVQLVTKKALGNAAPRPDVAARTNNNLVYDGPAFALLDYDTKAMPVPVRAELKRLGGFWPELKTVLPALGNLARLERSSTSSGLSRSDTGAAIPGSDGIHVYIMIKEGADAERFLKTLHERCWLAGLGWLMVGASGALLERSIVDRMVGQPGRPVFEGGPVLDPPLVQDKAKRRPVVVEGVVLDTVAECRPLSIVERARFKDLKAAEIARVAPEEAKERERFIKAKSSELASRTGMSEKAARAVIIRQREGVLLPDIVLPFDDPDLDGCTVGDVLADPDRFEGETMADPLEGPDYGHCCAKILRRPDGTPWIHSFAHGRTIYQLKYNAAHVHKAIETAAKDEVVAIYAAASVAADLSAVEAALRQQVKKLSGINLPAIDDTLAAAQQQHAAAQAQGLQAWQAAQRHDPRPQIPRPFPDEPWLPQMGVMNEIIGVVEALKPPGRDIDGDAMKVRKFGMHAFTDANDADEPEGDEE